MKKLFTTACLLSMLTMGTQAGIVDVTEDNGVFFNIDGNNTNGGSNSFVDSTLFDSDGALQITGDRARFFAFGNPFDPTSNVGLLSDLVDFSFQFAVSQIGGGVPTAQAPALRVHAIDPVLGRALQFVWEDGEQSSPEFVNGAGATNTVFTGNFFGSADRVHVFTSGGFGRGLFDIDGDLIAGSNSAQSIGNFFGDFGLSDQTFVSSISVGVGSSVGSDFVGLVDQVTIGFAGVDVTTFNFTATSVPVPAPLAMIVLGLIGLAARRRLP